MRYIYNVNFYKAPYEVNKSIIYCESVQAESEPMALKVIETKYPGSLAISAKKVR